MISDSEVLLNALQDEEKIKDFSNWNLDELVKKLNDSDKEKLLNEPDWFKNHGFLENQVSEIIIGIEANTQKHILANSTLILEKLQLKNNNIANIIATLDKDEDKNKLIDIYQLEEYLQVKIVTTYSDKNKEKFLASSELKKINKISILKSFDIDNLITYINNHKTDLSDLAVYEIIRELDEDRQEEFVAKLNNINLTEDEKREILVTLEPETKKKVDVSCLEPALVNALNMNTTKYGGKIIFDLFTDLEQYKGLDRLLISVDPTEFNENERAKFKQLCAICPQLNVSIKWDRKEENKIKRTSTASEYLQAEEWIEEILNLLKPEYTNAQKIAIIDNEIGKKISYSPDFDTEIFNTSDCRNLYKIISSGYGVCNGIARVEQYLFERAGLDIECEIVDCDTHTFLKLKDVEFELNDGKKVVGTTILDPTWNLTTHRFSGRPNNFCMSYEEARKRDIDIDGKDHKCHKNDEVLKDATFNLDDASLRNLFKSVNLANKDGSFPIKHLIDESTKLHQLYADDSLKDIEEQFSLLQKVCPEFASCQNSTMSILQSILLDSKFLKYEKCAVNRVYDKSDNNKRPITSVYINFKELGEHFYYADKEKGTFVNVSKKEFSEQFECYEKDLAKSNGIRPWEQSEQTEIKVDLAQSSGTIVAQKEGKER